MTLDNLAPLLNVLLGSGFNLSQLTILLRLHYGEATMSQIARCVGHSTAAATGSVDYLERKGCVKRHHATDDRRKVMVKLSPQGQSELDKLSRTLLKLSVN
jgi:DNA-binding MarR family transcriptional regulator